MSSSGDLIRLRAKKEFTLVRCLMMDSLRMESELYDMVERYYDMDFEYEPDMYFYAQGSHECPMCLVAHWDTLATYPLQLKMVGQIITRKGKGILGADDRAGVWAIFEILRRLKTAKKPLPSVLLTNYEEKGGLGVKSWLERLGDNCEDVLFIELDRKGANQYVDYSYQLPKQITNYMSKFGFIQHSGTYSDIADISDELLIPSVNVSVGYYEQHSKDERLHCDELMLTVNRIHSMCKNPMMVLHQLEETELGWSKFGDTYNKYSDWLDYYDYNTIYPTTKSVRVIKTP